MEIEETSVDLEADLPQSGQVLESFADTEVARIVDGGFGTEGTALLATLLDARGPVVDVERRDCTFCDDAGAEPARRPAVNAPVEDQLHLAGSADVEILADDLLKEHTAGYWTIEHLSERELGLQNGDLVAIAGLAVTWGERVQ